MKRFKLGLAGLSLIEMTVALGLVAGTSLLVGQLASLTTKTQQSVATTNDWEGLRSLIAGILSDSTRCGIAIGGFGTAASPGKFGFTQNITQINSKYTIYLPPGGGSPTAPAPLITVNSTFGSQLKITGIELDNPASGAWQPRATKVSCLDGTSNATCSQYSAQLILKAVRTKTLQTAAQQSAVAPLTSNPIPLNIVVDSNGIFKGCVGATAGTGINIGSANSVIPTNCSLGQTLEWDGTKVNCISLTCPASTPVPVGVQANGAAQCCSAGQVKVANAADGSATCCAPTNILRAAPYCSTATPQPGATHAFSVCPSTDYPLFLTGSYGLCCHAIQYKTAPTASAAMFGNAICALGYNAISGWANCSDTSNGRMQADSKGYEGGISGFMATDVGIAGYPYNSDGGYGDPSAMELALSQTGNVPHAPAPQNTAGALVRAYTAKCQNGHASVGALCCAQIAWAPAPSPTPIPSGGTDTTGFTTGADAGVDVGSTTSGTTAGATNGNTTAGAHLGSSDNINLGASSSNMPN